MTRARNNTGYREMLQPVDTGITKEGAESPDAVRVQIRLSGANFNYLKAEADRTGVSLNALASLAVSDWVDERRSKQATQRITDIIEIINERRPRGSDKVRAEDIVAALEARHIK